MNAKLRKDLGQFFGNLFSFNNSLKLYHWHVTGPASYAQHMALDQALEEVTENLDRMVETSYAMQGDIDIEIPETISPKNIVKHCQDFYEYLENSRVLFEGVNFQEAMIDDYQEAVQQLLYRLIRLQ